VRAAEVKTADTVQYRSRVSSWGGNWACGKLQAGSFGSSSSKFPQLSEMQFSSLKNVEMVALMILLDEI
jgi:hypothetical protein